MPDNQSPAFKYLFKKYPKTSRFNESNKIWVSEKIDGTNVAVWFTTDVAAHSYAAVSFDNGGGEETFMMVQTRNRFLTSDTQDHYGFRKWCVRHASALYLDLGYGIHYGEWWGKGIARNYKNPDRGLALFNLPRFHALADTWVTPDLSLVPLLEVTYGYQQEVIDKWRYYFTKEYSKLGDVGAEGIVLHDPQNDVRYKVIFDKRGRAF